MAIIRRVAVYVGLPLVVCLWLGGCMIHMPGKSHQGPLAPLTERQQAMASQLRRHVEHLATQIGPRDLVRYDKLLAARDYIENQWAQAGYHAQRHTYSVSGKDCDNLVIQIKGEAEPDRIVLLGAHYDTVPGSPGADDNTSGVAALLVLARSLAQSKPARTIRLVAFVNEEPPYYHTESMGSLAYARMCKQRGDNIIAMIALDGIGYYSDAKHSQQYPFPFSVVYPSEANFIGFQGNFNSGGLTRRAIKVFREHAGFPSEGVVLPGTLGFAGMSDHWSFWQVGYEAILVTDTLPFRYTHYHGATDTPDKLDYERMARVVGGIGKVMRDLAGIAPHPSER